MRREMIVLHTVIGIPDTARLCDKTKSWKVSVGGREAIKKMVLDSRYWKKGKKGIQLDDILELCDSWWRGAWRQQPVVERADPYSGDVRETNQFIFGKMYTDLGIRPLPVWPKRISTK